MRPLVLVAIAALGGAAMCGDDSASPDGGPDATMDAPRDVSADTPRDEGNDVPDSIADSRSDAGPALWTRFPNTPEVCDLEYAMAPASALEEIAWVDCPSGTPSDCALLEYEAGVSIQRSNAVGILSPAGAANPFVVVSQTQDVGGNERITAQLVAPTTPSVLAAWRYTSDVSLCRLRWLATDGTHLGLEAALPDKESLFFRTTIDALPSMPETPVGRLTASEQPGAVAAQKMHISPTTLGVVLQPGAVLWFFEDGLQMRRGGPLEPGVPGAVLNQFSIVDRRLYWATSANMIMAESLEASSELLHDPAGGLGVRWPQADHEFVVWEEWDGEDVLDLWVAPVPTTVADFEPRHVARLPEVSPVTLGEGLVTFVEARARPQRILLYDLRNGDVLQWTVPTGWLVGVLWVNREGVGLSAGRESATLFATVMTVPLSSFEPL